MIKSMTGFGKSVGEVDGKSYSFEIRSLNAKQLDLNLRMPQVWRLFEMDIRNWANEYLKRGKVDIYINYNNNESEKKASINQALAQQYANEIMQLASLLKAENVDVISQVLRMPEVLQTSYEDATKEQLSKLLEIANNALESFNEFRLQEGNKTKIDLENQVNSIAHKLAEIIVLDGTRQQKVKDKLRTALQENKLSEVIDENRFEQELIFYLEKLDINEEKVRLKSHLDYFNNTLNNEEAQGRKLGFICQEIGREINTIGSKCNDSDMQKLVVEMKDSLEKIKEQVLNIL